MDITFALIGLLLMLIGMLGSVLPVLPGTPVSWAGLIVLHLAPSIPFDWTLIIITGVIAIAIYVLDYIIPAIGTKKFGGSKAGTYGTFIGLLIGIFTLGPIGVIVGPFVGALVGEMAFNQTEGKQAFKAALGSFIGFLASTFMKFTFTLLFLGIYLFLVFWSYNEVFF